MISQKLISLLITSTCLAAPASGQENSARPFSSLVSPPIMPAPDFAKTVIPITDLKLRGPLVAADFGTGFCLDPQCRFVATAYHVAAVAQPRKIGGEKIIQRYLATAPDDEGATINETSVTSMKYALARDLAIFELRRPLAGHHGIAFSLDDLQAGQQVDIYAFPKEGIMPVRKLLRFSGAFNGQTTTGLLAFDYNFSGDQQIRPGASGGIVVDRKTQRIVGILNGIARGNNAVALAVPVSSLAEFVGKVQPWLAQQLFPNANAISPVAPDLYPKFAPPILQETVQHRVAESSEIKMLRSKAQLLADSMRNFVALQSLAWGSGDAEPAAFSAYEIQVLDGEQRFRKFPDGTKHLQNVPFPPLNPVMVPGGEWSELPQLVGAELGLKIRRAPDAVVSDRRVRVFQYWAEAEDGVCTWKSVLDLGFVAVNKIVSVRCYGEVWTDEETNILRISENYELPGKWKNFRGVVTYGWLERNGESPRLVPLTISTQAEFKKKIYWCRGQFTDYRVFTTRARIAADEKKESATGANAAAN